MVQAAFVLALASAAASLFVSPLFAGAAGLLFIVAALWLSKKLEKREERQAKLLAAVTAVLSLVLLCGRFIASAGIAAIAATCAGLFVLYALFKSIVSSQSAEAKVVSVERGRAIVEVFPSLLQPIKPGLHEVEAKGLKKGAAIKVKAEPRLFGAQKLKRAE